MGPAWYRRLDSNQGGLGYGPSALPLSYIGVSVLHQAVQCTPSGTRTRRSRSENPVALTNSPMGAGGGTPAARARLEGLEPPTFWFVTRCSIR